MGSECSFSFASNLAVSSYLVRIIFEVVWRLCALVYDGSIVTVTDIDIVLCKFN
jgi:hypothetical protein